MSQRLAVLGVFAVGVFGSGYLSQTGNGKAAFFPLVLAFVVVMTISGLAMEEPTDEEDQVEDESKPDTRSAAENVERKERNRD
ncbi:MAG: hypothetical protein K0U74_01775 [Alphaproteobacteria bacterium]|nr:hypothetical protein [Alphaproteobacteria bacterium]